MRSKIVTFRIPWPLYNALKTLAKERKFRNLSRFLVGLCIIAVQNSRRTTWVAELSNANPKIQDYILDRMLKWPLDLKGMAEAIARMNHHQPTAGPSARRDTRESQ